MFEQAPFEETWKILFLSCVIVYGVYAIQFGPFFSFLSSFFIYKIVATITNEIERKHDHYTYIQWYYIFQKLSAVIHHHIL